MDTAPWLLAAKDVTESERARALVRGKESECARERARARERKGERESRVE